MPTDESILPTNESTKLHDEPTLLNDESVPSNDETTLSIDKSTLLNNESVPSNDETTLSIDKSTLPGAEEAPPVTARQAWRNFVEPWWKATLAILPTFFTTRIIFLLLAYFGGILFFLPNYSHDSLSLANLIHNWYQWDAKRFGTIATQGYPTLEYTAFFPLFPALVHLFMALTHREVIISGIIVSNIASLGMLIVLYRFVETEFDAIIAKRTVLYISIFPTAFFFFAGYNESLFIFFVLLCFYQLRRGSWWVAGLFGLLATLTRSFGIFLAVIFVCEYLRQKWPQLRQAWREKQIGTGLRLFVHMPAVLLIPLGLGIFAYALKVRFHDSLAFVHAQVYWRMGLSSPLDAPLLAIKELLTVSHYTFVTPHNLIDLTALGLFAVLLILCCVGPERLEKSQWTLTLFGALALIYPLLFPGIGNPPYDPLPSLQRLVLEIFIGFVMLARLGRRPWVHQTYLLFSLPLLAFFVLQFMTGHWTI